MGKRDRASESIMLNGCLFISSEQNWQFEIKRDMTKPSKRQFYFIYAVCQCSFTKLLARCTLYGQCCRRGVSTCKVHECSARQYPPQANTAADSFHRSISGRLEENVERQYNMWRGGLCLCLPGTVKEFLLCMHPNFPLDLKSLTLGDEKN